MFRLVAIGVVIVTAHEENGALNLLQRQVHQRISSDDEGPPRGQKKGGHQGWCLNGIATSRKTGIGVCGAKTCGKIGGKGCRQLCCHGKLEGTPKCKGPKDVNCRIPNKPFQKPTTTTATTTTTFAQPGLGECVESQVEAADYNRRESYATEGEAMAACMQNEKCKGLWLMQRVNRWLPLYPGRRSWKKGVPNGTVLSVKKCLPSACAGGGKWGESEVANADYNRAESYATEGEALAVCAQNEKCKGIWKMQRVNRFLPLYPGRRFWKKGVPNGTVLSVKACTTTTTTTTTTMTTTMTTTTTTTICAPGSDDTQDPCEERTCNAQGLGYDVKDVAATCPEINGVGCPAGEVYTQIAGECCKKCMFEPCPEEGRVNSNECPAGCTFVDDCAQCELAAKAAGHDYSTAPIPARSPRPRGCFRNKKWLIKCNSENPQGPFKNKWPICKKR